MKFSKKYRISLYDDRHLADVGSISASPLALIAVLALVALFFICIGISVVWLSPIKNSLPGYLRDEKRSASEKALLRLDSLNEAYLANQAFIDNFLKVFDTDRIPDDSVSVSNSSLLKALSPDSLLAPTQREIEFVKGVQEKEKYNLSVSATLAADGIRFFPVNPEGVFTENSRNLREGIVALPARCTVNSLSDGRVIEISQMGLNSGSAIVVQHSNGFLSKISGTGKPLVQEGDWVLGAQPIALSPASDARHPAVVSVSLWHNGFPLVPYEYLDAGENLIFAH